MTTDYLSPSWRLSGDLDWVAFKNDFRHLCDIADMFAATLQRIVYKVDLVREDKYEEQPKEVHYVADPTLIKEPLVSRPDHWVWRWERGGHFSVRS
ncbi:hypothetical protein Taro_018773 [Colocasia esculenta]|uniref:Uncharacterized protein n=1 Tax=Colocasia esculenta TaxID=4460 RepID=A0A843UUN6_COLES|nr:hypothetical protein [Colocasia esculenta]